MIDIFISSPKDESNICSYHSLKLLGWRIYTYGSKMKKEVIDKRILFWVENGKYKNYDIDENIESILFILA